MSQRTAIANPDTDKPVSAFASFREKAYEFRYDVEIVVNCIAGGTPYDVKVAEGWLRTKIVEHDDLLRAAISEVQADMGVDSVEAAKILDSRKHLNGFRKFREGTEGVYADDGSWNGVLYICSYQVAAMLKEASMIAVAAGRVPLTKWGVTNKNLKGFWVEHVAVGPEKIPLQTKVDGELVPVTIPTGISQRFPNTFRGTGIQYEEFVESAVLQFQVVSDFDFEKSKTWEHVWLTAESHVGIGASRGQGFGRFTVTKWDRKK